MIAMSEAPDAVGHRDILDRMIVACRNVIAEHEAYLCELDCAIGDGDHGTNMRRGLEALMAERAALVEKALPDAVIAAGTVLVMTIGGAAGPLYGTLLIEFGKGMTGQQDVGAVRYRDVFGRAVAAVARRGKCAPGQKTLLDVLHPAAADLAETIDLERLATRLGSYAEMTAGMKAMRGRASFLGERSRGHVDPGAASCALLGAVICHELAELEAV